MSVNKLGIGMGLKPSEANEETISKQILMVLNNKAKF